LSEHHSKFTSTKQQCKKYLGIVNKFFAEIN
jgi:hypothetical protein